MSYMTGSQKTWLSTLAITGSTALLTTLCAIGIHGVTSNDAAKIERDKQIKIECIKSGKQLISGNCVNAQLK